MIERIDDARILMIAAQYGSFARVARELSIPVATVSRRVAMLEDALGARLFERTTRSLRLTDAGRVLLNHASRIVEEVELAQAALESMSEIPTGHISIAAPINFGQGFLSPIVAQFLKTHPQCDIYVDLTNAKVDFILGEYDIAIRVGDPGDQDVIAKCLGKVSAGLYTFDENLAEQILNPIDLQGCELALLRSTESRNKPLVLFPKDHGDVSVQVATKNVVTSGNPWLLKEISRLNNYIFSMPDFMNKSDSYVQPKQVLSGYYVTELDVYAVYLSRKHLRPAVRAFLDLLRDALSTR